MPPVNRQADQEEAQPDQAPDRHGADTASPAYARAIEDVKVSLAAAGRPLAWDRYRSSAQYREVRRAEVEDDLARRRRYRATMPHPDVWERDIEESGRAARRIERSRRKLVRALAVCAGLIAVGLALYIAWWGIAGAPMA